VAFRTIKLSLVQKLTSTKGLWEFFLQGFAATIWVLILQWISIMPSLSVLTNISGWTIVMFVVGAVALGAGIDVIVRKIGA